MTGEELERALDDLYAGPLDAFVKARDALAAALKKAGDKAGAAAVKSRARPSVSAWAVNRLWSVARKPFDELLASGDQLKEAQRHALSGGGADRMKAALAARRAAVGKLLARAREELDGGGHPASAATLQRITSTLHALTSIGDRAELGRLTSDVGDDGLEGLLAAGSALDLAAPTRPEHEPVAEPAPEPDDREKHERERKRELAVKKAEERVASTEHAYRAAETKNASAQRALEEAQRKKASRRADVEAAERAAREAEERLREARRALADEDADVAAGAATEADRALGRAKVDRDAALEALRAAKA